MAENILTSQHFYKSGQINVVDIDEETIEDEIGEANEEKNKDPLKKGLLGSNYPHN